VCFVSVQDRVGARAQAWLGGMVNERFVRGEKGGCGEKGGGTRRRQRTAIAHMGEKNKPRPNQRWAVIIMIIT
jgi:hypothetical protein